MRKYNQMEIHVVMILVFLKGFSAESGVASQASNSGSTCGIMLDNILRLERAFNNMSWELELTKREMKNNMEITKVAMRSTEMKLESAISRLSRLDSMDERINEVFNITEKLGSERDIFFRVKQIKHPYITGQHDPFKFDDVTENKGGAYNTNSGIFTVPRTGTYLCWANIMAESGSDFTVQLMKNGQLVMRGYTGRDQEHGTATITDFGMFNKGDHVWFVLIQVSTSYLSIFGEHYSSYGCFSVQLATAK